MSEASSATQRSCLCDVSQYALSSANDTRSGPFLAVLSALGGKYAAKTNAGVVGEATRAVGRIASAAGEKAKEERLLGKLKAVASAAGEKAKEERLLERLQASVGALFGKRESSHNPSDQRTSS